MKNKRMKLTALAMSVLMAMSTITSVTWAADLFTDGAPAEVAVEAPVEADPIVEDEIVAEDASLNGYALTDLTGVRFYIKNGTVVASYTVGTADGDKTFDDTTVQMASGDGNKVDRTCYYPEAAIYTATFHLGTTEVKVLSSENQATLDGRTRVTVTVAAPDLRSWVAEKERETPGLLIRIPGGTGAGYILTPGSDTLVPGRVGHNPDLVTGSKVVIPNTCSHIGIKATYLQCPDCGKLINNDGTDADFPLNDLKRIADPDGDGNPVSVNDLNNNNRLVNGWINITSYEEIPVSGHTYDTANSKPVTGDYITFIRNKFGVNSTEFAYVNSLAPVNCYWQGGKMVADPNVPNEDAYYYTVYECKNCGRPIKAEKVYLTDVNGILNGTYYEAGDNIQGFLGMGANGKLTIINDRRYIYEGRVLHNANGEPIPVMDPGDCTKIGYYKVLVFQSDILEPVSSEQKEVRGTHAWGSTEVAPNGTPIDASGTLSQTENDQLLKDNTITDPDNPQKFVVVRDTQGNVTEAKSKNCVTRAKYQLYHTCLVCGAVEKVGDLKTTDVNSDIHQWGNWAPNVDDSDSDYINKGDYHEKYTYQHRTCDLCGKRDLKLFEKIKESHTLTETKVEGGDEKEPTCGEAGYYTVQLQCPCGYADTNSTKKTTIPPTDAHDFGDNEAEMIVVGNIQIGGRTATEVESSDPTHIVYGTIVRKCNVCDQYDSNGIGNTIVGQGNGLTLNDQNGTVIGFPAVGGTEFVNDISTITEEKTLSDYIPAKTDPTTGVPYSCSVGKITVTLKWAGKVDGSPKMLEKKVTVPYYPTELSYAGARAHDPAEAKIENKVDATAETAGSYDKVIYCRVCGDEISRETITVDPETIIPAPTAKATPVNYNTINITWNAVEGATSYDVYYRSAALGVNDWTLAKKVTGTSFDYSGLITGVKYRFTVSAAAGENNSEFGANTSVATPKLAAPEIKTVTAVKKGTKVTWTKVDGASGYIIQRKTSSGKWTRVGTVKKGAKVSWTDKKAVSGSKYRVRAYRTVEAANISKNNVYGPVSAEK